MKGTPFKMKGSPMQRNFGVGSPVKQGGMMDDMMTQETKEHAYKEEYKKHKKKRDEQDYQDYEDEVRRKEIKRAKLKDTGKIRAKVKQDWELDEDAKDAKEAKGDAKGDAKEAKEAKKTKTKELNPFKK